MKKFIKYFGFCLFASIGFSQEQEVAKIDGAFGVSFGQVVDSPMVVSESKMVDGTPLYQFKPLKEFRDFSKYWLLISPKGRKVHTIIIQGKFESDEVRNRESELLQTLLTDKYGKRIEKNFLGFKISQEGSLVSVREIWNGLQITYCDTRLEEEAEKERLEIEGRAAYVNSLGSQKAETEAWIEGAFGVKLGDKFVIGDRKPQTVDGRPMYAIEPSVPFRSLDTYYAGITPNSGLIYRIECHGMKDKGGEAHREQFVLDHLLLKRFGQGATVDPKANSFFTRTRIQLADRYVETTSNNMGNPKLKLVYCDTKLEALEKQERLEGQSKKVDASGL